MEYVKGRPFAPIGDQWQDALTAWGNLHSDEGASFDLELEVDAKDVEPQVSWGTSPEMVTSINGSVPDPEYVDDSMKQVGMKNALSYMDLVPGTPIIEIQVDKVFIGSCTNSRIEDLRIAASVAKGRKRAENVKAVLVVPGSGLVKAQAEKEGLDVIFKDAGFEWREPGCSMCLGMNADQLDEGERCASTSNRNFEGRQGRGGRTHLVSPAMASAAGVFGHFVDVRGL